ncbi:MAG TPA: hypothetical protein VJ020_05300 [Anaerolineales bacterium]|nr:hypothetical protein [Anaerolineales bacterium]
MTDYTAISTRIGKELEELEQIVERCLDIWAQFESSADDRYLDGVAFNLQSFYTGIERILELIVDQIDQDRPSGPNWHQLLMELAATEIPQLRSAVISASTVDALDRYRGFRHVARNIYAFNLDSEQMAPLIHHLQTTFESAKNELSQFAQILAQADANQEQDNLPD